MASLETYKKLKEEILSLIGDSLLEDDEFFLTLVSKSKDSKGVLRLAWDLKEEGNTYFKKGEIDDALEKYGYAMTILPRYHFVEEEDRVQSFKLAICILMNSAVCFSKKREFLQVGRICSIVLDFDQNNVKAMFRRAMAALELGKKDLDKLDLLVVAEIDPNNKEVINKLEGLQNMSNKKTSNKHGHDDVPAGLGIVLSSPKKKVKERLDVERLVQQDDTQQTNPDTTENNNSEASNFEVKQQHDVKSQSQSRELETISLKEENNMKDVIENVEDKKDVRVMEEDVGDVSSSKVINLAEPKYRFVNRRRPGSSITISRNDYQKLVKGKSIYCVNSRLRFPMTIRLVLKEAKHEMQMADSTSVDQSESANASSNKMESRCQRKGDYVMEVAATEKIDKEVGEAETTKDSRYSNDFGSRSSGRSFQSVPSIKHDQNLNKVGGKEKDKGTTISSEEHQKEAAYLIYGY